MSDSGSRRGGGAGTLVLAGLVLAVLAVVLSEGLRDRVLDALFGAEEEFDYEPAPAAQSVNGTAEAASQTSSA